MYIFFTFKMINKVPFTLLQFKIIIVEVLKWIYLRRIIDFKIRMRRKNQKKFWLVNYLYWNTLKNMKIPAVFWIFWYFIENKNFNLLKKTRRKRIVLLFRKLFSKKFQERKFKYLFTKKIGRRCKGFQGQLLFNYQRPV